MTREYAKILQRCAAEADEFSLVWQDQFGFSDKAAEG